MKSTLNTHRLNWWREPAHWMTSTDGKHELHTAWPKLMKKTTTWQSCTRRTLCSVYRTQPVTMLWSTDNTQVIQTNILSTNLWWLKTTSGTKWHILWQKLLKVVYLVSASCLTPSVQNSTLLYTTHCIRTVQTYHSHKAPSRIYKAMTCIYIHSERVMYNDSYVHNNVLFICTEYCPVCTMRWLAQ